jgi:two-component system cell cycle sensor histidine kinase/response regulator CckA
MGDATERTPSEQELRESHRLLSAIVEGSPDGLWFKDLHGRYLMINTAGARWLGKSVGEIIGKTDFELLPLPIAQSIMEYDRRVLTSEQTETFEVSNPSRTFLTTKDVYRDPSGKVVGLIGISRDITQQRRLEEQLRQAQKMEAVGRLAGGVAHDFNNLLTVINGYSELVFGALEHEDPSRAMAAEIRNAGERGANLTRQLLAFSRQQVLHPKLIDLNVLLSDLTLLMQRLIGEDIELAFVAEPRLGLVKVDPGQIEQAILNLAVNARDAMAEGGRFRIETCNVELGDDYAASHGEVRPGRYVLVEVTDSGHGMDAAIKARIFEPFFTTKPAGKGTGLGLAMVYGIVKQSGGHLDVHSERGRGSTFRLYLPRAEESSRVPEPEARAAGSTRGDETILVVEDENAVRALARHVLEAQGYRVLEARDGQEALDIAQQYHGPIDLLVTDLVMPRMGGRQLAEALTHGTAGRELRVLFISGYTDDISLASGVLRPGASFLQKPFGPTSLARRVRELLDTPLH